MFLSHFICNNSYHPWKDTHDDDDGEVHNHVYNKKNLKEEKELQILKHVAKNSFIDFLIFQNIIDGEDKNEKKYSFILTQIMHKTIIQVEINIFFYHHSSSFSLSLFSI